MANNTKLNPSSISSVHSTSSETASSGRGKSPLKLLVDGSDSEPRCRVKLRYMAQNSLVRIFKVTEERQERVHDNFRLVRALSMTKKIRIQILRRTNKDSGNNSSIFCFQTCFFSSKLILNDRRT